MWLLFNFLICNGSYYNNFNTAYKNHIQKGAVVLVCCFFAGMSSLCTLGCGDSQRNSSSKLYGGNMMWNIYSFMENDNQREIKSLFLCSTRI